MNRINESVVSDKTALRGYGSAKCENILEPISKTHWNEFKTCTFGNQIVGFSDVLLHILTEENEYWKPVYA